MTISRGTAPTAVIPSTHRVATRMPSIVSTPTNATISSPGAIQPGSKPRCVSQKPWATTPPTIALTEVTRPDRKYAVPMKTAGTGGLVAATYS